MVEEVDEFLTEANLEELADIVEVIYALAKAIGHDVKKLDEVRRKKILNEDPSSKGYS
nr:MazG-like family protein [Orientia tsutsugamushi]